MAVSERKREANRLNAQKSTGPITDEGKARASQNAVKHGLTASSPVLLDEDPAEFEAFAAELRADLRPRTAMQRVLVERIIFVSWKLRRIPAIEVATAESARDTHGSFYRVPADQITAAHVLSHEGYNPGLARLQMYEMRLERSLHASLRQLEKLKKMQEEENEPNETEVTEKQPAPEEARVQNETSVQNEATGAGKLVADTVCDRVEDDPTPSSTTAARVEKPCHESAESNSDRRTNLTCRGRGGW